MAAVRRLTPCSAVVIATAAASDIVPSLLASLQCRYSASFLSSAVWRREACRLELRPSMLSRSVVVAEMTQVLT
jgi:hypothetical protein